MDKQSIKELCEMNDQARLHGVLSAGGSGERRQIHLTAEAFARLFDEYETVPFMNIYERHFAIEDGFEFFALVPKW